MKKRALCILTDGFEEIEAVTPVDLLRRAEVEVVIAGLEGGTARGRCGMVLEVDAALDEVGSGEFDLLLIPGGPGVERLRKDGRAAELARRFGREGKEVAAICAAPLVLHDAGLLDGRRFTAHFSTREELPELLEEERVVEDGRVTTSRGAGTALEFGLALVEKLAGRKAREDVAAAVMA